MGRCRSCVHLGPLATVRIMVVSTVRVLYADTDQMGVVNHAIALRWFEQARAEWLRRLGYTYREFEDSGLMLPVYEVAVRYHKPALYDQLLALEGEGLILQPAIVANEVGQLEQLGILQQGAAHADHVEIAAVQQTIKAVEAVIAE